jgi:hypothetical protein
MIAQKRRAILVGVMLVLLAAAAAWNASWMLAQRDAAQHASDDLAACRELTATILSQRDKPAVAAAEAMGVQELGKRIEAAFGMAQIASSSLGGVDPQTAHRVGDSPYLRKPTSLSLRGVSPRQVATFLFCLTDESGLSVRDLRLSTPHGGGAGGAWDAEATLTYLIYSPAKTRRDR